jgi:hypothetical protein
MEAQQTLGTSINSKKLYVFVFNVFDSAKKCTSAKRPHQQHAKGTLFRFPFAHQKDRLVWGNHDSPYKTMPKINTVAASFRRSGEIYHRIQIPFIEALPPAIILFRKMFSDIQCTDTALTGEHPEDIGRTVHAYVAYW